MYHQMDIGLSGISLAEVIWVSGRMCDHVGSLFDSSSKFICHLINTSLFTSSIQIYSYHCFFVDHLCLVYPLSQVYDLFLVFLSPLEPQTTFITHNFFVTVNIRFWLIM